VLEVVFNAAITGYQGIFTDARAAFTRRTKPSAVYQYRRTDRDNALR